LNNERQGNLPFFLILEMELIECLKYSVGLSQVPCECLTDPPEESDRSDSGYYLDDMEIAPPLQFPKAATDCEEFWTMMERARADGIRDFITDFLIHSRTTTTLKLTPFDGYFMDWEKINLVLTGINQQYLVSRFEPIRLIRGGVLEVRKVGLILNTAGTYTVNIYRSIDLYSEAVTLTPYKTIQVTVTTPGVMAEASVPMDPDQGVWKLPLWDGDRRVTYFFVYDPVGAKPYNVKFDCGCTGGLKPWQKHLYAKGLQVNDVKKLVVETQSLSDFSYGLAISGSLTCDGMDWMCRNWNYKTDSFGRVMARLIQLYSIRKLHALILNSRRINAYTLLKPESLQQRIIGISQMIADPIQGNMPYLIRNIPRGVTGCWECESPFKKGNISV